jgi:hypothetical protein
MEAAPDSVAEEDDEEQGIDQQDVLYGMVLFLAAVTLGLFSRNCSRCEVGTLRLVGRGDGRSAIFG